ncbi:MAG: AbgT family transporter [Ignavibacteria bacterium]|nr:AbgT family transporter [Ignavibacteria bacterium]
MSSQNLASRIFNKSLDYIEIVGNRLPHPATLFGLLALIVVFFSWLGDFMSWTAIHPADNSTISVKSLLSGDGIRWIYTNITHNFVNFPPLGYVLAVMIGIGVAEGTGLFTAMIRSLVLNAPSKLITGTIVLAGIISHLASEAGYVILIPLGAIIFHSLGRHPMAGLAAAFCGVSGGFGANFLIGSVDPILAGLSQSAAQIIEPEITINAAVNLYFMVASAIMIVILGTWVTEKIVEPRLKTYTGTAEKIPVDKLSKEESKGLKWAGLTLLGIIVLLAFTVIPDNGVFRNPATGDVLRSPFFDGIITGILLFFLVPGIVYGIIVKTIKNDKDMMKHIIKSMGTMSTYIVLVFFAAQFVYFFRYSNLGLILAIQGADFLRNVGLTGIPLLVMFVLLAAFINMFMGSASAKWAIMAPVFIPMFMLLGYHPALTQAAFRIGDSVTNLITPMMSYFALIVAFAQKYDEKYGIGTIISTMIPYTVIFTIFWTLLLVLWMWLGIPTGPDGPLFYP